MYEITEWDEIIRIAPAGARFFRYRRSTGERRKFYEGGFAFPLAPEELADRKPAHRDGVFAVHFYTEAEADKPAEKGAPMVIQPPNCDEVLIEFRRGFGKSDGPEGLIIREILNTNKDLARTAASSADAAIRLYEKTAHERDVMAEEVERNRIGPVWQIILEHHPEIKNVLVEMAPAAGALAQKLIAALNNSSSSTLLDQVRKEHQEAIDRVVKQQGRLTSLITSMTTQQRRKPAVSRTTRSPKKSTARRSAKKH